MRPKLLRITTHPISLHKLLQGQANYMQEQGFDVILASAAGKEIEAIEKETGLTVYIIPLTRKITIFQDLIALWKTYKLIKKEKPNIVHTHTPKAGIIGMLAAKMAHVPARMHTVAGLPLLEAKGFRRKILNLVEKITYSAATNIYPNSFGLKQIILDHQFTDKHKLKVLANGSSNGIDTHHFDPAQITKETQENVKKKLGINKGDFVFTFIGRIVGDKGINELVLAFEKFQTHTTYPRNSVKLLLIGDEEPVLDALKPKTKIIIKENENIISTGWVDDVRTYLTISDVFVFPSYREGLPNVVIQAGAMGLPSIVTDINGSNEIIIPYKNGLIIPVKDSNALFYSMQNIYTNEELRQELATNARGLLLNKFQQKVVWEALLKEYMSL
jgi:glycosyltransferase involved in cell wall biosynthesis